MKAFLNIIVFILDFGPVKHEVEEEVADEVEETLRNVFQPQTKEEEALREMSLPHTKLEENMIRKTEEDVTGRPIYLLIQLSPCQLYLNAESEVKFGIILRDKKNESF